MNQRLPSGSVVVLAVGLLVAAVGVFVAVEDGVHAQWADLVKVLLLLGVVLAALVAGARAARRHQGPGDR